MVNVLALKSDFVAYVFKCVNTTRNKWLDDKQEVNKCSKREGPFSVGEGKAHHGHQGHNKESETKARAAAAVT